MAAIVALDAVVSPLLRAYGSATTIGWRRSGDYRWTCDPLMDDTLFMAARWNAAGNVGELAVYPGGVHAFNGSRFSFRSRRPPTTASRLSSTQHSSKDLTMATILVIGADRAPAAEAIGIVARGRAPV